MVQELKGSLGMVGLGRMGANMVQRLQEKGIQCAAFDRDPEAVKLAEQTGAIPASNLKELVESLQAPRCVWMMVPAGITPQLADELSELLSDGDILIDGGNSHYRDAVDRNEALLERGIHYIDVGTSGGVFGLERGYCLMVGGAKVAVDTITPVRTALAPGIAAAPRSEGRTGEVSQEELGFLHCGGPGAGHFVKMVHNGIEYGLMAAYAEGFNILRHAGIGKGEQSHDAETAPLKDSKYYQYDFELDKVAELWRRGSVIPSWLLDLTASALSQSPELDEFGGKVSDSGEGRWTQIAAIDEGVPAHVLSAALFDRFNSRGRGEFGNKVLSAMRLGFGGHHEKK